MHLIRNMKFNKDVTIKVTQPLSSIINVCIKVLMTMKKAFFGNPK